MRAKPQPENNCMPYTVEAESGAIDLYFYVHQHFPVQYGARIFEQLENTLKNRLNALLQIIYILFEEST